MDEQALETLRETLESETRAISDRMDKLFQNSASSKKEDPDKNKEKPNESSAGVQQWIEMNESGRLNGKDLNGQPGTSKLGQGETNLTGKTI